MKLAPNEKENHDLGYSFKNNVTISMHLTIGIWKFLQTEKGNHILK